jgi:hypothetical protein
MIFNTGARRGIEAALRPPQGMGPGMLNRKVLWEPRKRISALKPAVVIRIVSSEIFAPGVCCLVVTAKTASVVSDVDIPSSFVVVRVKDVFGQ